jgi:hypothetical protein
LERYWAHFVQPFLSHVPNALRVRFTRAAIDMDAPQVEALRQLLQLVGLGHFLLQLVEHEMEVDAVPLASAAD